MDHIANARRANLEKLATYLEELPSGYEHFDMMGYFASKEYPGAKVVGQQRPPSKCGAVACAIGHGPSAGIEPRGEELLSNGEVIWSSYGRRNFIRDDVVAWGWLFASHWESSQPTHRDAAARIRYFLDNGEPPEGWSYEDRADHVY